MKIAIMGTGAMGSVYAALLGDAGNEVWAIDAWQAHVDAWPRTSRSDLLGIIDTSGTTSAPKGLTSASTVRAEHSAIPAPKTPTRSACRSTVRSQSAAARDSAKPRVRQTATAERGTIVPPSSAA